MYAAQGADLEVDSGSGRVTVLRIVGAHDVNRRVRAGVAVWRTFVPTFGAR